MRAGMPSVPIPRHGRPNAKRGGQGRSVEQTRRSQHHGDRAAEA
jgi:hypothetical protein